MYDILVLTESLKYKLETTNKKHNATTKKKTQTKISIIKKKYIYTENIYISSDFVNKLLNYHFKI